MFSCTVAGAAALAAGDKFGREGTFCEGTPPASSWFVIAYIYFAWRRGIWLELHLNKPLYRCDFPTAGFDFDQSLREKGV